MGLQRPASHRVKFMTLAESIRENMEAFLTKINTYPGLWVKVTDTLPIPTDGFRVVAARAQGGAFPRSVRSLQPAHHECTLSPAACAHACQGPRQRPQNTESLRSRFRY